MRIHLLLVAASTLGFAAPRLVEPPVSHPRTANSDTTCVERTKRALGFLEGSYTVSAVFREGASWDSNTAHVLIRPALGGCVMEERFRGRRYRQKYDYLAWWSSGSQGAVDRAFVHSQHGIVSVSRGGLQGDTLVVTDSVFVRGRWIEERVVLWRTPTGLASEGRRTENGSDWFITQRTVYRRTTSLTVTGATIPGKRVSERKTGVQP